MRILAIDPGKTTGFSLQEITERKPFEILEHRAWEDRYTHDQFIEEINEAWPTHVVCESFVFIQKSGIDYYPIELIGLVKWLHERGRFDLDFQTPSYGKGFFSDRKLKQLGLYERGKPHAMDALRHNLQYQIKQQMFDLNSLKGLE